MLIYSHEQKKVYTRVFYFIQYLSNIFKNGILHIKLDKISNKSDIFCNLVEEYTTHTFYVQNPLKKSGVAHFVKSHNI